MFDFVGLFQWRDNNKLFFSCSQAYTIQGQYAIPHPDVSANPWRQSALHSCRSVSLLPKLSLSESQALHSLSTHININC